MGVYYMLVTRDRFELPISWPMRCKEMAEYLGMTEDYIRWQCYPSALKRKRATRQSSEKRMLVSVYLEEDAEWQKEKQRVVFHSQSLDRKLV